MRLVLDAEPVVALTRRSGADRDAVFARLQAARRLRRDVVVPAVVLAELYRGRDRVAAVDSLLVRQGDALQVRDTDRPLARLVGGLLEDAGAGSEHLADAHVVACAVEGGGGVVLTGDPDDLRRLAAPHRSVVVEPLGV